MLFRVLNGKHIDGASGKVYHKGEVIDSALQLDKKFRNKFERIMERSDFEDAPKKKKTKVRVKTKKGPKWTEGLGSNVTKQFPFAEGNDLLVFKRGTYYYVHEDEEKTPINEKGVTKKKVTSCIKGWLEE